MTFQSVSQGAVQPASPPATALSSGNSLMPPTVLGMLHDDVLSPFSVLARAGGSNADNVVEAGVEVERKQDKAQRDKDPDGKELTQLRGSTKTPDRQQTSYVVGQLRRVHFTRVASQTHLFLHVSYDTFQTSFWSFPPTERVC